MLEMQYNLLVSLDQQITGFDKKLEQIAKTNETCKKIQKVEGIGPVTAVALTAMISIYVKRFSKMVGILLLF